MLKLFDLILSRDNLIWILKIVSSSYHFMESFRLLTFVSFAHAKAKLKDLTVSVQKQTNNYQSWSRLEIWAVKKKKKLHDSFNLCL